MAKVEIELSEIEKFKDEIKLLKTKIAYLEQAQSDVDPKRLRQAAIDVSINCAREYMRAIFKAMGLTLVDGFDSHEIRRFIEANFNKARFEMDKEFQFNIGLRLFQDFQEIVMGFEKKQIEFVKSKAIEFEEAILEKAKNTPKTRRGKQHL